MVRTTSVEVTYHIGQDHGDGLTQHHGLRLDASHPPPDHSEVVDHRGVAVRPHDAVRVEETLLVEADPRKVLQVDLVNNPRPMRHNQHVQEGLSPPLEEGEPLVVPLKLQRLILGLTVLAPVHVHLN